MIGTADWNVILRWGFRGGGSIAKTMILVHVDTPIMWWRGIEQRCREIMNIAVAGHRAALGRRSQLLNQLLAAVVIAKVANELIRLQIRPN